MNPTLQDISNHITPILDFPREGIVFRDISPLLLNNKLFNHAIDLMAKKVIKNNIKPDFIAGFESRGFLFRELANKLDCGFVMIRKPNKLPNCKTIEYEKEYGKDSICITNCVPENSNVLLVDDLLATGGTVYAGYELIKSINCNPIGAINLIQLCDLQLNQKLHNIQEYQNFKIMSVLLYQCDNQLQQLDINLNKEELIQKTYIPLILQKEIYDKFEQVVFCHPTLDSLANKYITLNYELARKGTINWNTFPDGKPNITFESVEQIENKKIVFFLNLYDTSILFEQLSMLMVLPRQFIKTLDIYITYFSVGTMERVDKEGILATAETMSKIISSCIENTTCGGKPTIHIWDIHALPNRFYFDHNHVNVRLHSGIPFLIEHVTINTIIVFPDDGACKRFKHFFPHNKTIVCSKIRENDKRVIRITDKINFPKDQEQQITYDEIIIVDDLIQSGGTLIKCKEALEQLGYNKISAYVTHAVFPNEGWNKIVRANFHKFYTTNTIPQVTEQIKKYSCFHVFNIFTTTNEREDIIIFVPSHNKQKLQAVYNAYYKLYSKIDKCFNFNIIVKGINVPSNVPEQPINEQGMKGAKNRCNNLHEYLKINNIDFNYICSLENSVTIKDDICYDICNSFVKYGEENIKGEYYSHETNVIIPKEYVDVCIENNQNITIGQVIQDKTGIPKNSWHEFFNELKLTRVEIMEKTIITCNLIIS